MDGRAPITPIQSYGKPRLDTSDFLFDKWVQHGPHSPDRLKMGVTYDNVKQVNPIVHDQTRFDLGQSSSIQGYEKRGFPIGDLNGPPTAHEINPQLSKFDFYKPRFAPPAAAVGDLHGSRLDEMKKRGLIK